MELLCLSFTDKNILNFLTHQHQVISSSNVETKASVMKNHTELLATLQVFYCNFQVFFL